MRAKRRAAGLSMAELGRLLGVSHQQIQKYEAGVDRVSGGTLLVVAEELNGGEPPTLLELERMLGEDES
ncbi:MAG: helix-turn-helix transcriptional regulator [Planctomycetota bacterium]